MEATGVYVMSEDTFLLFYDVKIKFVSEVLSMC